MQREGARKRESKRRKVERERNEEEADDACEINKTER